ncbi:MAG: Rrf2 family transcriptional regulator [Bifidobacteriaceae bacterium]|nr:Rrf2 family transcriptional regulator [Bifidobacteriaceae bacterium]
MDTRFSVALHILSMVSESKENLSSQALAKSVGGNPSYIRKVIVLLKNAQLIDSSQGRSGYKLLKEPKNITLLEIYYATQEIDKIRIFELHKNSNKECPVGKNIEKAMTPIFMHVEQTMQEELSHRTLQNVIDNLYQIANK